VSTRLFIASVVAAFGAAACALGGSPAMAGDFLVLPLMTSALRRFDRRLEDVGNRLDEMQVLHMVK
jgi:hypothetical protein